MAFEARYEGQCADCGERIRMGELIVRDGEHFVHQVCDPADTDLDRDVEREVCTECFLVKPCPCQDGL